MIQNDTLEERVSLLETQMLVMQDEVTEVDERVELVEGDVNFLFEEQIIQDERLLSLEQENDVIDDELESKFPLELWRPFTTSKENVSFCIIFWQVYWPQQ